MKWRVVRRFSFFVLFLLILGSFIASAQEVEKGSNYDTICDGATCTTTVYSYEKYFLRNETWEEIDENFFDCSTNEETKFCTKDYRFNIVAKANGEVSAFRNGQEERFKLADFRNNSLRFAPVLRDGMLVYEDVIPNYVDIEYKFYPDKLKENIVLKQPLPNVERDFDIKFLRFGNAGFSMADFIICDSNDYCEELSYNNAGGEISLSVPREFLQNQRVKYPVYIDPTITLDYNSTFWNGYVTNRTERNESGNFTEYTRASNPPSNIKLGLLSDSPNLTEHSRGAIEWNVSAIPDYSHVSGILLSVYSVVPGESIVNVSINFSQIEGGSEFYNNNKNECQGNCHFYIDMENGTLYTSTQIQTDSVGSITLQSAANDLEEALITDDIFKIGISSWSEYNQTNIRSKDAPNPSNRPVLSVVYGANSTDANSAIVEGIGNILPGNPIESGQKVYLVDENGQHYTGTFDKTTIFGNQSWVFNYVLPSESFIGMPSLFRVLNVWEEESLTYQEIVDEVGGFINSTRY